MTFQKNIADVIIVTGAKESSVRLAEKYLLEKTNGQKNISPKNIFRAKGGQDTIGEAFASKEIVEKLRFKRLLIITSDKHLKRALWIFRRIYGGKFIIKGKGVPCGNLSNESMERKLLLITKDFFTRFTERIEVTSLKDWYKENSALYEKFRCIYREFYPSQAKQKCQAYLGVDYMNRE